MYGDRAKTALPYAMNSEFSKVLAAQMVQDLFSSNLLLLNIDLVLTYPFPQLLKVNDLNAMLNKAASTNFHLFKILPFTFTHQDAICNEVNKENVPLNLFVIECCCMLLPMCINTNVDNSCSI